MPLRDEFITRCVEIRLDDETKSSHLFCTNELSPVKLVASHKKLSSESYPQITREKHELYLGIRGRNEFRQRGLALSYIDDWTEYPPDIAHAEFDADDLWRIRLFEEKTPHMVGTEEWHRDPTSQEILRISERQIRSGLEQDAFEFLHRLAKLIVAFDLKKEDEVQGVSIGELWDFDAEFERFRAAFPDLGLKKGPPLRVLRNVVD